MQTIIRTPKNEIIETKHPNNCFEMNIQGVEVIGRYDILKSGKKLMIFIGNDKKPVAKKIMKGLSDEDPDVIDLKWHNPVRTRWALYELAIEYLLEKAGITENEDQNKPMKQAA